MYLSVCIVLHPLDTSEAIVLVSDSHTFFDNRISQSPLCVVPVLPCSFPCFVKYFIDHKSVKVHAHVFFPCVPLTLSRYIKKKPKRMCSSCSQ